MGVFDDHKLGQLDWMTQITETIDSDLNGLLARLPDRTLMTVNDIIENSSNTYLSLSVGGVIRKFYSGQFLSWEEEQILRACFRFEASGEITLDLKNRTISGGELYLVKVVPSLSDEQLMPLMGVKGLAELHRLDTIFDKDNPPVDRANEVLDILGGCNEAMRSRSMKNKINGIRARVRQIFETNEWRIRDMTLSNKVGYWIKGYLVNANLADFTNLCKLKVMTHNNMPIYSVKEEQ